MISASEATIALTSSLKAFNLTAEDAIKVVDKLTKVDQLAAVSAGGISTALQKSATSAKLAGMSMDELIGSVSVIGEVTQQSMDTVGNAMKSILARYGNVKASVYTSMGLDDDGETTENINDIEKVLRKLGIQVRSSATEMRSITDVLDDVNEKWDTFDTVTKNAIATAFGGTRMRENFLVLMENWDRVKELTEEAADSAGTADKKYESVMESMETATKSLEAAWERLSTKFETSPMLINATKLTTLLVENLDKVLAIITTLTLMNKRESIISFGKNTWDKKGEYFGRWFNKKTSGTVSYDENGKIILTKSEGPNLSVISRAIKPVTQAINSNGNNTVSILQQLLGVLQQINVKTDANGRIASGLTTSTNKPAFYDETEGVFRYSGNHHKITNPNEVANLKKQKDAIDQYNASLGTPASSDQISSYQTTWWGNKAKSFNIGDTHYLLDENGNYVASEQQMVNGVSTHTNRALTSDEQKQADELNKTLGQQKKSSMISGAVAGGVTGAISALLTQKNIGEKDSSASGLASQLINKTDQQITETAGDKAGRVAATAIGGAIGSIWGPLGAMVGQVVGEFSASIISNLVHRTELEIKQRAADAKENLKALNSIKSTIEENTEVLTKESLDSEDFNKLQEFTQKLREQFVDYDADQKAQFIDYFKSSEGLPDEEKAALEQFSEINTIEDIVNKIENGNVEQRKLIKQQLEIAAARQTAENLVNSQAEDRAKYGEVLEKSRKASGKLKIEEIREYYKNIITDGNKGSSEIEQAEKDLSSFNEAVAGIRQLNKEVAAAEANVGFLAADIFDLSNNEISDLTMDGIVGLVVKALEGFNVQVRDSAGYIKEDYLSAIKTLIETDSRFNTLLKGDTKTLNQLYNSQEKFEELVKGEVKDKDNKVINDKTWENLYALAQQGKLSEEIAKIVYAANPDRIEQFAAAWNTTRKNLNNLVADYPNLTTAIGLMSPSEVREYYSVFTDFFSDLVDDSTLTAENFEKLLKSYPQLLKYYKAGSDTLSTELIKAMGDEQTKAYINSLTNEIFKGAETMDALKSDFVNVMKEVPGVAEDLGFDSKDIEFLKEYYNKYIDGETTIEGLLTKAYSLKHNGNEEDEQAGENIENLVNKYLQGMREIQIENPLYKAAKQAEIDHISDIIDNLTEQKDMLSKVNDERKKEIELIRAKNALEDAKKEKKRVYRAGVGWTYESDEEAISTAQENLENLDTERQQQSLQYQIDQYEIQKSILENLDSEKQKEAYKKALEEWGKTHGVDNINDSVNSVVKALVGRNSETVTFNLGEKIDQIIDAIDAQGNEAKTGLETVFGETKGTSNLYVTKDAQGDFQLAKDVNLRDPGYKSWWLKAQEQITNAMPYLPVETIKKYQDFLNKHKYKDETVSPIVDSGQFSRAGGEYHYVFMSKGQEYVLQGVGDSTKVDPLEFGIEEPNAGMLVKTTNGKFFAYDQSNNAFYEVKPNYYGWAKRNLDNVKRTLTDEQVKQAKKAYEEVLGKYSLGTTSFEGGNALINELGTEALITPHGTLTSLPSKTGIVPADLTKNVWALGEVAPTLIAQLRSLTQGTPTGVAGNTTYEEGQYIDSLTMNVYPTKDYDMDKLLMEARAKMRLTRHNN